MIKCTMHALDSWPLPSLVWIDKRQGKIYSPVRNGRFE
jgi:hypothetical protein